MVPPDRLRLVRFRPYNQGPTFSLELTDLLLGDRIGYTLRQHEHGKTAVIFSGKDFRPSPLHAWDADATVAGLMTFLTLRPGDTDADYFATYTPAQLAFRDEHAEALSTAAYARFSREP